MSGIAGIFRRDGEPASRLVLEWMSGALSHRGPDGEGIFLDTTIGMAHRCLAAKAGVLSPKQPLTLEERTLVYDGEVYNFQELRAELEGKGHGFVSDSQAEVLLRSYLEWGRGCFSRFNGEFAFALWDPSTLSLVCARDRMGVKPFFYALDEEGFEFASEIKALLHKSERRRPRPRTLARFLGEGVTDDEWETFFEKITVLPPAHTLVVTRTGLRTERYWKVRPELSWQDIDSRAVIGTPSLPIAPERLVEDSFFPSVEGLDEAAEAFRALLLDSVRLRVRPQAKVGTFLSGGLDSSSVVASAASLTGQTLHTFSLAYGGEDIAEKRFVDDVVAAYGCIAGFIQPEAEHFPLNLERMIWHQDEPTAGPLQYGQWCVMGRASRMVKVLLDGSGGNELLAGYHYYFAEYLVELAKELRAGRQGYDMVKAQAEVMNDLTGDDYKPLAKRAIRRAKRPRIFRFFQRQRKRPNKIKKPKLLNRHLASELSRREAKRTKYERLFTDSLSQYLYNDLTRFSIPALLRYSDRSSMAFSMESRAPFLDHRLVEFCLALPTQFKIAPPLTKLVLRKAMNGRLPPSVTTRTDRPMYPTSFGSWLRQELREWVEDTFSSQSFAKSSILNPKACKKIWRKHLEGQDRSSEMWRILYLYRWSEICLRPTKYPVPIL